MILFTLFAFLHLLDHSTVVQGVQCSVSFAGVKCSPCGKGTRCNTCEWCTGYCSSAASDNNDKRRTQEQNITHNITYGSEPAPYKTPLLDIFRDVERLLKGDLISELDVVNVYRSISATTREDCIICNQQPDLDRLSNYTYNVSEVLRTLVGNETFKNTAIEKTVETYSEVEELPYSIKILVENSSTILESVKRGWYKIKCCSFFNFLQ